MQYEDKEESNREEEDRDQKETNEMSKRQEERQNNVCPSLGYM